MAGEGILGWTPQSDAVEQEQHAGDDAHLEQAFDECGRGSGLAGSRRRFDQQRALSMRDLGGQRLSAFDPIVAIDNPPVDVDDRQAAAVPARHDLPLEVVLVM